MGLQQLLFLICQLTESENNNSRPRKQVWSLSRAETLQLTLAEMLVHKELTSFIVLNKLSRNFFFQICYSMITPWPLEEQKHLVHPAVVAAESRKRQNQFPKMKKNKREKKACAPVHDPCYVNDWSAHVYIFFFKNQQSMKSNFHKAK